MYFYALKGNTNVSREAVKQGWTIYYSILIVDWLIALLYYLVL